MPPRPEVIEELVQAALAGMTETALEHRAQNDEVISAYFTLMRRGIEAAMRISTDPPRTREALRGSVMTVLLDLTDPRRGN